MRLKIFIVLFLFFDVLNAKNKKYDLKGENQVIYDSKFDIVKNVLGKYETINISEFKFYETINKYDFNSIRLKIVIVDDRKKLNLFSINCSRFEVLGQFENDCGNYNASEFVAHYINFLFKSSNIIIDSTATDVLEIHIQSLDAIILDYYGTIGYGFCQMEVIYKDKKNIFCAQISLQDYDLPFSKIFWDYEDGAKKLISASIKETIEKILKSRIF